MRSRRAHALAGLLVLPALGGCEEPRLAEADAARVACRRLVRPDGGRPEQPIRWVLPSSPDERAPLDAYCAAVGPAVLENRGVRAAADEPAAEEPLVVVAWNVELGHGRLEALVVALRAGRLTGGRPVRHFVLLLQEAHRGGSLVPPAAALPDGVAVSSPDSTRPPDIVELARRLELSLLYVPMLRNGLDGAREDHGNAILATLPLREPGAIELPHGLRRRVAAVAAVEPPAWGTPLRLVSVHLDNFSWRRPLASFGGIRTRQAGALASRLPAGAVIVGGDLNTWRAATREGAYRVLRQRLPRPENPQPEPTARRLGVPRQLDYLLASLPAGVTLSTRRAPQRFGSDHYPVVGRVERRAR